MDPIIASESDFGPPDSSYNTSDEDENLMKIYNPSQTPQMDDSSSLDTTTSLSSSSSSLSSIESFIDNDKQKEFDNHVEFIQTEIINSIVSTFEKNNVYKLYQQYLYLYIKSIIFRCFWKSPNDLVPQVGDSDDIIRHKVYGNVLCSFSTKFGKFVTQVGLVRTTMIKAEILRRVDGDMDHPALKAFEQILLWREIHVKRKQKRAPLAGDFFDAWTLGKHRHQREMDVIYDPVTKRPLLDEKNRIITQKIENDNLHEGDDPMRLKEIHFFPKPSDRDPNIVDPKDADDNHFANWCIDEIKGDIPDDLNVPVPFFCSLPQFAVNLLQLLNNVLNFKEYCITKVVKYLEKQNIAITNETTFEHVWRQLAGKKENASVFAIGVSSSKKDTIITIAAEFRNILRTNMDMLTCNGCNTFALRILQVETCPNCKQDTPTSIYICPDNDECKEKAFEFHRRKCSNKEKKKTRKKKTRKREEQQRQPKITMKPQRKPLKKKKRKRKK
jgi:hypothetical protein